MKNKLMLMFEQAGLVNDTNRYAVDFGLIRLGATLLDLILAMICAFMMGNAIVGFIFEVSYIALRIYAGGYHASSKKRCLYLTYFSTFICIVWVFVSPAYLKIMNAVFVLAVIFIAIVTPVQSENKPLNKKEVKVYRRNAVCISTAEMGLCLFFEVIDREMYAKSIFVAVFLTVAGLLVELLQKRGRRRMKKINKKQENFLKARKFLFVVIFILMTGLIFPSKSNILFVNAAESANTKMINSNLMANEHIGIFVSDEGRFSIGTTGGNPENYGDDDKKLLYGYPNGTTSYTTFCVDGEPFIFIARNCVFNTNVANHIAKQDRYGIHIEQELMLIKNSATGRDDVVEIRYTVTNSEDTYKNVGCRIMMDTQIGENDFAPFRIPGYGAVTTETEFEGEDIPQIWQAFDDLSNPGVIAQGRFYKKVEERPDKVQFANWNRLSEGKWEMTIGRGRYNGDSAVAATWCEKPLAPGESRVYKTYYGMSELTQDTSGTLILSLYAEAELETVNNSYVPNPFPVSAYIENVGNEAMDNVEVSLELPQGLSFADGNPEKINIGKITKGEQVQENWQIRAEPVPSEKYYKIKLVLQYGSGESKYITRTVHVPALKRKTLPKALEYALFSESNESPLSMYGWQSYIIGNVYTGNDYTYQGSILGISGKVDTVGTVTTNGWQLDISEINENQPSLSMLDLDAYIMEKAGDAERFTGSKIYTEDTTVLEQSICSDKDITFAQTNFSDSGYIIAGGNITCGLNHGSTFNDGKVVMYAKQGDIALNGSEIALDGILYAPNGTVYVNANIFRLCGRIIAKHIVMNASQVFIEGADSDIGYIYGEDYEEEEQERRGFFEKTFSEDEITTELSEDGIWTVVCDAGKEDTEWKHITWNGVRMDDSDIEVIVQTSNDEKTYSDGKKVRNGAELEEVYGRYLKASVKLLKSSQGVLPRLSDITISTENADLLTNSSPVFEIEKDVYKTSTGVPVTVILGSRDDAVGEKSSYSFVLNTEDDEMKESVEIEDVSPIEKKVIVTNEGTYNFTAVVTDGEFEATKIITIITNEQGENREPGDIPGTGEGPDYEILGQIEKMEFNEDFSSIKIIGTANAEGHLKKYILSYAKEETEGVIIINENEEEIVSDVLGEIPAEDIENGDYVITLTLIDESDDEYECRGKFKINAGQILPEWQENPDNPDIPEESQKLTEEELNSVLGARQNALEWLKAQADENGSWDRNGLAEKTGRALAVIRLFGEEVESAAFNQWSESNEVFNTDEMCHFIWGNPDAEIMKSIWDRQNADGGFGLTEEYESNLYDTLLVLITEKYMRDLGYPEIEVQRLNNAIEYIANNRNEDGGFGYNLKDESRVIITAEYAWLLSRLGLQLNGDDSLESFCKAKYVGDFEEPEFLDQCMLSMALMNREDVEGIRQTLQKLQTVQKENGSVYDNVDDTMIFILIMDDLIKEGE